MLEGALIAAYAVSAPRVVVAMKGSFERELERMRTAVEELREARVATDVTISVVEGPDSYLFGEETGLLEVIDAAVRFRGWRRPIDADRAEDRNRTKHGISTCSWPPNLEAPESPAWPTTSKRWPTSARSWPTGPIGSGAGDRALAGNVHRHRLRRHHPRRRR
ncbi:MAG: hypothetical protein IPH81_07485 [Candidatus Microthrix sp.]|nr:hypothetical protein [Candidatus Microthrix sp.]